MKNSSIIRPVFLVNNYSSSNSDERVTRRTNAKPTYIASFFSNPLEHYTKWREFFVGESKNTTEFYGQSAFTPLQNVLYERVKMLRPEPML